MSSEQRSWFRSSAAGVLGFLAIAAYFLWEEHRAHLLGFSLTVCCCLSAFAYVSWRAWRSRRTSTGRQRRHENDGRIGIRIVVSSRDQFLVFIIFAFSFAKPQTKRDWRSFSAFSAFHRRAFRRDVWLSVDDLFDFWLVIKRYPDSICFPTMPAICGTRCSAGKSILTSIRFTFSANSHFCGFILLSAAWKVLYEAQHTKLLRRRDRMLTCVIRSTSALF